MRNDRYGSLDGIKGFALIGIIWYHLSQRSLPGGFIGWTCSSPYPASCSP